VRQTFFEVIVVICVIYNSIATPRAAQFPIRVALQNDGIIFFMIVLVLRLFNTLTAAFARPSLALIAVLYVPGFRFYPVLSQHNNVSSVLSLCSFMWGTTTTAFSRSLFRLRDAELKQRFNAAPLLGHRPSRYGTAPELELVSRRPGTGLPKVEVHTDIHRAL
jgi:hypothetical protein